MKLNIIRMHKRLDELSQIGRTSEKGACRIALTQEDKKGRDLLVSWMEQSGLEVHIDQMGNIFGILKGKLKSSSIMMGSHIDTVGNGGHLDGMYGVIAGLEVIATLVDLNHQPRHDLCVANFTNEEGVRFQPDMMGSLVYAGGLNIDEAYKTLSSQGDTLKDELKKIGYLGDMKCGSLIPRAFIELHIEQGPVLENKNITIGVVNGVQGISWTKVEFYGQANHAGTTPMELRHDAGFASASLAVEVRKIAEEIGPSQVATVGVMTPKPNLINVVPGEVHMTVDLRNSNDENLCRAEVLLDKAIKDICEKEGVTAQKERLVRFEPVIFDEYLSNLIEQTATRLDFSNMAITSGAGHDAQMMARICPTAMIFVPSRGGISHNPKEYTATEYLDAGAELLFETILKIDEQ